MWKVKLVGGLLALFIIGTMIFLVLDPGGDIYNQYLSLGNSSKSGFDSKKEFNYQSEIRDNQNKQQQGVNGSHGNKADLANYTVPDNLDDVDALRSYVNSLPICDERKKMLNDGLNIFKQAKYSMQGHNNWTKDTFDIIECSGFVAWAYNRINIQFQGSAGFNAPSTNNYEESADMTIIDNADAIPGDIGHIFQSERTGVSAGHVGLYFGKNSNGERVYMDAGGGTGKPVPRIVRHSELDKRTIYIKAMEQLDNAYYASAGSSSSSSSVGQNGSNKSLDSYSSGDVLSWDDSWEWASNSKTHTAMPTVYKATDNRKDIVVALNPGHGSGAELSTKVNSYPDISNEAEFLALGGEASQYAKPGTLWQQAGHTGGATMTAINEASESEWCLDVCNVIKDDLLSKGYDVIMLRTARVNGLDNPARAIISNQYADIHVSVHFNSASSASTSYMSAYFSPKIGFKYYDKIRANSEKLANGILTEMQKVNDAPKNQGFSEGNYSTPRYSSIPFCYVECGFGSNAHDANWMTNNKNDIGLKISTGIDNYFK